MMEPRQENNNRVLPASSEADRGEPLADPHILVVEDMGLIAIELRQMLEEAGCAVVGVASRLGTAMEYAQTAERLDGVLLDLNLSGESAYPVADTLRQRGIPFIIMSGYDTSNLRADCAGDAHLQKPFSRAEMTGMMIRTFLPAG